MTQIASAAAAAASGFMASFVEAVEALTIVLAAGAARGYRAALLGVVAALAVLALALGVFGQAVLLLPLGITRCVIGALLLGFGLRWLVKAVRRAAGRLRLRDEAAIYVATTARLAGGAGGALDRTAMASAFSIVMIEGAEVVFILVALTASRRAMLVPAALGAGLAALIVAGIGAALRRPMAKVPENLLKLGAGTVLTGIGAFLLGEGLGLAWPGGDAFLPVLVALAAGAVLIAVRVSQQRATPHGP